MVLGLRRVIPVDQMQSLLVSWGCKRFVNYLCIGSLPPPDCTLLPVRKSTKTRGRPYAATWSGCFVATGLNSWKPSAKRVLQGLIQDATAHSQKRLDGPTIPSHLLRPAYAFGDDLIDLTADSTQAVEIDSPSR